MSLRFSIDEAQKRGWISAAEAERQRAIRDRGRAHPHEGAVITGGASTSKVAKAASPERLICSIDGDLPQEKLWRACVYRWPEKVRSKELVWEYPGAVPGRRFRLDIAFPVDRLACEVDGWEHHGKYLADFKRDRERDRCLVLEGWRVLRFYAEEIHQDSEKLVHQIEKALSAGLAGQKF
jgi:hypothetical protein